MMLHQSLRFQLLVALIAFMVFAYWLMAVTLWKNYYEAREMHNHIPITAQCERGKFSRVGANGDGGKWVCGEYFRTDGDQCVIFSIGSNGDFSFETEINKYANGKCKIHTFDCTGNWPAPSITEFHQWCLGPRDEVIDGRQFKTWDTVVRELGVTHVNYLKIDIEGYEWSVIPDLLMGNPKYLPSQISMEIHMFPPGMFQQPSQVRPYLDFRSTQNFLHPLLSFFGLLQSAGYHATSVEYNPESVDGCCSEVVLVRKDYSLGNSTNI